MKLPKTGRNTFITGLEWNKTKKYISKNFTNSL